MGKYLQLYLDSDFILPIAVNESGDFYKYADRFAQRRMWLFFSKAASTSQFVANEVNKAGYESRVPGVYGDFWNHIEKEDIVQNEVFSYLDLLEVSGIISTLRELSRNFLGTDSPEIVLNFSTTIPVKARKTFAKYVEQKIGKIKTYSFELNELLADKILFDHHTIFPKFGDQLFIAQSTGNDILLSTMTWCGDMFMQGEEPARIEKKGNEFMKKNLVRLVVNHQEMQNGMLTLSQLEEEYAYQMQYAEEWLENRNGDDFFLVRDFHYKNNPSHKYPPVRIDGKQLNMLEAEDIRSTIELIRKYYTQSIVNNHLHTIFVGDVFKEKVFIDNCVCATSSNNKYTFFNDNAIQEALGRYNVKHSTSVEELSDLERIYMDKANERNRIRSYVHNAEILGSLLEKIHSIVSKVSSTINAANERNSNLESSWEAFMKRSAFNEAIDIVSQMSISDELAISKNEAFDVLKAIERSNSLLIELILLKDVKPIVDEIRKGEDELRELSHKVDELIALPNTLKATIQKYQDMYPAYKELKIKFDVEHTLTGRKIIVDEMKNLTMEPMPILDVELIKGDISVKVVSSGGLLGMGAKRSIELKLSVDNPLPCRGVFLISPKTCSSIPERRMGIYSIDIDKGAQGIVVDKKTDLQSVGLDKNAKQMYVYFYPHEDEKIPINRFDIRGSGSVKL